MILGASLFGGHELSKAMLGTGHNVTYRHGRCSSPFKFARNTVSDFGALSTSKILTKKVDIFSNSYYI